MHWSEKIKTWAREVPCEEAVEWAKGYPTLEAAWDDCPRADWMLCLATRVDINLERHRMIVRAVCEMVRHQLCHVPEGELRPLRAIEAAEAWADDPSKDNAERAVMAALEVSKMAMTMALTFEATWVTWAAEYAAWAVATAISASFAADWAEQAAVWMAVDVGDDIQASERKAQADILRKHLTCPEVD